MFRKVKRALSLLPCLLAQSCMLNLSVSEGPNGQEEGSSAPLFNILLLAWLYLGTFLGGGEVGQEFLPVCILSTFKAEGEGS